MKAPKIYHFNTFKKAKEDYGSVKNYRETLKLIEEARQISDIILERRMEHEEKNFWNNEEENKRDD